MSVHANKASAILSGSTQFQDPLVETLLKENQRLQQSLDTERKRNELFQSVFNCLPDALMIADSNRAIQMTNPGVAKLFGYGHYELAGEKTAILYESQGEFEAQGRARFNLTAEEQLVPYRVNYRRKNGEAGSYPNQSPYGSYPAQSPCDNCPAARKAQRAGYRIA